MSGSSRLCDRICILIRPLVIIQITRCCCLLFSLPLYAIITWSYWCIIWHKPIFSTVCPASTKTCDVSRLFTWCFYICWCMFYVWQSLLELLCLWSLLLTRNCMELCITNVGNSTHNCHIHNANTMPWYGVMRTMIKWNVSLLSSWL